MRSLFPSSISGLQRLSRLGAVIAWNVAKLSIAQLRLLLRKPWTDKAIYNDELWRLRGRAIKMACLQMGATFIKLGQILSTRRDLLPTAALSELEQLQDNVPPFDGKLTLSIFERDFGQSVETVFASFQLKPIASGSVAQVHRATLKTGEEVAIKVIRPNIEHRMNRDVAMIVDVVKVIAKLPLVRSPSAVGLAERFGAMVKKQLDLTIEAQNNARFRELFKDTASLARFPDLVEQYCSKSVLTMTFCPGEKPTLISRKAHDVNELAKKIVEFYYRMVVFGLIHADLHPGNLLVSTDEFYWILDVGLVAELEWDKRKAFFEAWMSIFQHDGGPLARLLMAFAITHDINDYDAFEAEVTAFLERNISERIADIGFGRLLLELGDLQRKHKIVADPSWMSVCLSLVAVEGLARHFQPDLSIARTICPLLKKMLRQLYLQDPKLQECGCDIPNSRTDEPVEEPLPEPIKIKRVERRPMKRARLQNG